VIEPVVLAAVGDEPGSFEATIQAIYSYEGTWEINTLIVGRAITGLRRLCMTAILTDSGVHPDVPTGPRLAVSLPSDVLPAVQ
jgi:hypothetical protein